MHPNVHIVTRNSNEVAIKKFLRLKGVPIPEGRVHCVKKQKKNKVDVIFDPANLNLNHQAATTSESSEDQLQPEPVLLFVDDDINEHMVPELQASQWVHRVLFVRAV